MTELKPCPFCGSEASGDLYRVEAWICCTGCEASIAYPDRKEAVTAWNRRVFDEEIETLKNIAEKRRVRLIRCNKMNKQLRDANRVRRYPDEVPPTNTLFMYWYQFKDIVGYWMIADEIEGKDMVEYGLPFQWRPMPPPPGEK